MQFRNEAKLVRRLRLKSKLTQIELSKHLGFPNSQFISNIERGVAALPPKYVLRFTDIVKADAQSVIKAKLRDYKEDLCRELWGL